MVVAFSELGQRRWNRPGPGNGKELPMQEKPMRGESAKQVAIDVLRAARKPLRTKEIAKRVIESGRCPGLKGKTPEATIAAMLAVGSKAGGPFKRQGHVHTLQRSRKGSRLEANRCRRVGGREEALAQGGEVHQDGRCRLRTSEPRRGTVTGSPTAPHARVSGELGQ
jgi:HB1, ASXL, restriction endonuclease HTH domain